MRRAEVGELASYAEPASVTRSVQLAALRYTARAIASLGAPPLPHADKFVPRAQFFKPPKTLLSPSASTRGSPRRPLVVISPSFSWKFGVFGISKTRSDGSRGKQVKAASLRQLALSSHPAEVTCIWLWHSNRDLVRFHLALAPYEAATQPQRHPLCPQAVLY